MTWEDAMEARVRDTGHERYRQLCADDHPEHEAWRAEMIRQVTGESVPIKPPSLARQVADVAKTAAEFAASRFALADPTERDRRLAICLACEFYDSGPGKCLRCGCRMALKTRLLVAKCPINLW